MSRIPEGNSIKSWFWQYTTQKNSPSSGKNLTYSSFIRKQTKQLEKKQPKLIMKSFMEELYSENLKHKKVMRLSLRVEFVEC